MSESNGSNINPIENNSPNIKSIAKQKQLRIFIVWSKDRSKEIALALRQWLPKIFKGVEIFMSQHDIVAGTRWNYNLNQQLEKTQFGIVCITRKRK